MRESKIVIWKERYIKQLVEYGLERDLAIEIYEAGLSDHDYDSCPEMAASDELSYWNDNDG